MVKIIDFVTLMHFSNKISSYFINHTFFSWKLLGEDNPVELTAAYSDKKVPDPQDGLKLLQNIFMPNIRNIKIVALEGDN